MTPLQESSFSSHYDFIKETQSSSKVKDITKIQAYIRGWKTRNEVFLPHQILPFVTEHFRIYRLLVNNNTLDIARLICSEINKMSINPEKYKGKRIQLLATDEIKPKNLFRSFNLFIEMDDADTNIELLIEPDAREKSLQSELGWGRFKRVYKAQVIKIPRELILDQRIAQCSLNVLVKTNDIESKAESIAVIQHGMRIHNEILQRVAGKFVDPYIPLKPSPEHPDELYYKQAWYNGDFYHVSVNGNFPLNFFPNSELIPFTLKDLFKVFSDVAKSLKAMHEQGYVHRDIHAPNLFIKWNGGPNGYIGDLDIAQKVGVAESGYGVDAGDFLSFCYKLVFPSTDICGLANALCLCLLPVKLQFLFVKNPYRKDYVKRVATNYFYKRLAGINIPEFKELQKLFSFQEKSGEIIPCHSAKELKEILHARISNEHKNLLNQLETELSVIDEAFKFAHDLRSRLKTVNSEMGSVPEEVKTLKNPEEWLNYFNTKIVPKLYDPAEVYEKFDKLATLLQNHH